MWVVASPSAFTDSPSISATSPPGADFSTTETEVGAPDSFKETSTSSTSSFSPDLGGFGAENCQNGFSDTGFVPYGVSASSANITSVSYTVPSGQTNDYVVIMAAVGDTPPGNGYAELKMSGVPSGCTTHFIGYGYAPIENNITGILCTGQSAGTYTITASSPNSPGSSSPDGGAYMNIGVYVFTSTSTSTTVTTTTSTTSTTKTTTSTTSSVSKAACSDSCVKSGTLCVCPS